MRIVVGVKVDLSYFFKCCFALLLWSIVTENSQAEQPANVVINNGLIAITDNATPVTPILDIPLRDVQIFPFDNRIYYMTGTLCDEKGICNGVYTWSSSDLKRWKSHGKIIPLRKSKGATSFKAPEIHYFNRSFYVVVQGIDAGIDIFKSKKGIDGPYHIHARLVADPKATDPSLFFDNDSAYLIYNGNYVIQLSPDLTTTVGDLQAIYSVNHPLLSSDSTNLPSVRSKHGSHIVKIGAKYHFIASSPSSRFGGDGLDMYMRVSDHLIGPYSERMLIVPHAAHGTLFQGFENQYYCSFSSHKSDRFAAVICKPVLVEMRFNSQHNLIPVASAIFEKGVIGSLHPLKGLKNEKITDASVCAGGDGLYYMVHAKQDSSSISDVGFEMWQSPDLKSWKNLGIIWQYSKDKTWQNPLLVSGSNDVQIGSPRIVFVNGAYNIVYTVVEEDGPKIGLLRSAQGKPQGSYSDPVGGKLVNGACGSLFQEQDKAYLLFNNGEIAQLNSDFSAIVGDAQKLTVLQHDTIVRFRSKTSETHLGENNYSVIKYRDSYVLFAAQWYGKKNGTHDLLYATSENLFGPYLIRKNIIPHGGLSVPFLGVDDLLYATVIGNDATAPFRNKLGAVEFGFDKKMEITLYPLGTKHREFAIKNEGTGTRVFVFMIGILIILLVLKTIFSKNKIAED